MADQVTDQDLDRVMEQLSKFAPALEDYLKTQKKRQAAEEKASKSSEDRVWQFDSSLGAAQRSIKGFTRGMDGAVEHFAKSILSPLGSKAFIGIAAFTALWDAGKKLNDTWKDMTDIGQTFGGSMFAMQHAADAAGVPLDVFAKLQKQNNVLINATGKQFWKVNKQLSDNVIKSGMYGMSLEQLGNFTGAYMEVSRRNGSLQTRSIGQLVGDMDGLALTTTALAAGSDKAREQIEELATSALTSAHAIAGIAMLPETIRGAVNKSVQEMTTVLASIPGEAGKFMSQFAAETTGAGSPFTAGGKTLIEAGMSGLASEMDETARAVKSGRVDGVTAGVEMQNKMIDAVNNNIENLNALAIGGNQSASELITMFAGQKKLSMAEIEQKKKEAKNAEAITALMASIGTIWERIKTSFSNAFGNAFARTFDHFTKMADSPVFKHINDLMAVMGDRMGAFLGTALTESNINMIINGVENVVVGLVDFTKAVAGAKGVWNFLGGMFGFIAKTVGAVARVFNSLGPSTQKLIGMVLGGILLFKGIKSLFGKMFGNNMVVNARNVTVNGGGGGGGGSSIFEGLRDGAKGAKGGAGRLLRAFRGGGIKGLGRAAGRMTKGGIGSLLRGLGGSAGGGARGLLKGGGRLLGRAAPLLGGALEAVDYIDGDKSLSWKNLAKSGLALGGGALGALGGGLLTAGLGGEFIGGAGGYAGGQALGNMIFGGDDHPVAKATTKAAAATTAAAASIAASNQAMMDGSDDDDGASGAPTVDPMTTLIEEVKQMRMAVQRGFASNDAKADAANRLLSKIEVSAQSL